MLFERIRDSLTERARHFSTKRRTQVLRRQLNYQGIGNAETLQTIASTRALIDTPVDTIIDVGAHRGLFARPAAEILGARQVICYEPSDALKAELEASLSGLNFQVRNVALSNKMGESDFFIHPDESMNSLAAADRAVLGDHFPTYDHDRIRRTKVEITTLDEEAGQLDLPKSSIFLKLDTQGTELDVLAGARSVLPAIDAILLEYMFVTPYVGAVSFEKMVEQLSSYGFRCKGVLNRFLKPTHAVSGVDLLFTR